MKDGVKGTVLDIAIAGMGMGGLCLVCLLAEQGHRVVLYDQMEKPGPVGSGFMLQPTGLMVRESRAACGLSQG